MRTRPTPQRESQPDQQPAGISNRETAQQEARERHPPAETGGPPPEDASGRAGQDAAPDLDGQTSHKAGSRSIAQKEDEARYPDRAMPASKHAPGAFGKEPTEQP